MMHRFHTLTAVCALAFFASACSSGDKKGGSGNVAAINQPATFVAGGSIGQVWVTDATPGQELILTDADSNEVARGTADRLGSFIFRDVPAADGYTVRRIDGDTVYGTPELRALAETDPPDPALLDQVLVQGLNYVKMRDGVELAMTVRLPGGKTIDQGPFPTLIEHSGYQVAAPGDLLAAVAASLAAGGGLNVSDPLLPATSTAVGSLIAPILGFAAVSVQMRGSGCSGGDFQLFDRPTTYDGYDMVEIVANQPWVKGNKVAMGGISFSGISQFFAAGTRPPHLAAVSPMSVMDETFASVGFPGGIFNNGFAQSWLNERMENAQPATDPAPNTALPYSIELVNAGDQHCIDNQKLRVQTQDINAILEANPFRDPALVDHRSPAYWADKIEAPTFLIGAFQDEQTGGHWTEMIHKMDANPDFWVSMQNGVHCDSLGPQTFSRWVEFLSLFAADEVPVMSPIVAGASVDLYKAIASGSGSMPIPAIRFDAADPAMTPAVALAEFRKDPRVRVLFENGGNTADPGSLEPMWEHGFDAWPVTEAVATSYYLDANGALSTAAPSTGEVSYTGDPSVRPLRTLGGTALGDPWAPLPGYNWAPVVAGAAVGFVSPVLTSDVLLVGTSSLDLTIKSSAPDTDLQATISEVRPDGQEMYVQSGWLRASHRALDAAASSPTDPIQTHLEADAADMPSGAFTTLRLQIYSAVHAFRVGSRIRLTIQAPGGERTTWNFDTIENGTIQNTLQLGPSKLVLPLVPNVAVPTPRAPCPSLRGQPCRVYTPASNGG